MPIVLRGECLGVLEFFSREARPPDLAILEMMNSLGTQIGQFIERHQMRARVIQSEKLASLGMLSAGVAHEINNPLAYVANNLAVLERDVRFLLNLLAIYEKADDSLAATQPELIRHGQRLADEFDLSYVKENMGKILQSTRQGIKRVADIVQNLRGFARLDRAAVDQADIHEAIQAAVEMLQGPPGSAPDHDRRALGELPPVAGSPAQLNQVFLNLLVNAMQAIESTNRGDGRISITTECQERRDHRRGGRQRLRHHRRGPAPYLRSVLHDQGDRRRDGPRALDHPQPGSRPRRPPRSRERARSRHPVPRFPAGGQGHQPTSGGLNWRPRLRWTKELIARCGTSRASQSTAR